MSSLGGLCSAGNFSFSRSTVSIVSSTESVVWESQTTFSGSRTVDVGDVVGAVDERDVLGRLAGGADDLLVALVADEQDVVVVAGEADGLLVDLGHQRAGRVDGLEAAGPASSWTTGATPCAEKMTVAPSGTSSVSSTKIAPRFSSVCHDVLVVHDLLADVDRGPYSSSAFSTVDDGAVDARAVAAGRGEQDLLVGCGHASMLGARRRPPQSRAGRVVAPEQVCRWAPSVGPRAYRLGCVRDPLPEKAADTTAEQPVAGARAEHQDRRVRRPDVAALGRGPGRAVQPPRGGTAYLTLRDPDVDMSLSVSVPMNAVDAMPTPLTQGARVVLQAKPTFWTKRGTLQLEARQIRPVGVGDLLARVEILKRTLAAEGLFDAERKRPLPFLPDRVGLDHRARLAPPRRTSSRTPAAGGRRCGSRSARSPSRAAPP